MELQAKIAKQGKQIRIQKFDKPYTRVISINDAKKAWGEGRVTKCNKVFARLASNEFDVRKTLDYYLKK